MDGSTGELYRPGNTAQEANSLGWDGEVCLHQGWMVEKCFLRGVGWVCFLVSVVFKCAYTLWGVVCMSQEGNDPALPCLELLLNK